MVTAGGYRGGNRLPVTTLVTSLNAIQNVIDTLFEDFVGRNFSTNLQELHSIRILTGSQHCMGELRLSRARRIAFDSEATKPTVYASSTERASSDARKSRPKSHKALEGKSSSRMDAGPYSGLSARRLAAFSRSLGTDVERRKPSDTKTILRG